MLRTIGKGLHHLQPVAQVVPVLVEEALLLNEVDEHHAIEHQGGVPVAVALGRDPFDEVPEDGQFSPEAFVEALGNFLNVEGLANEGSYVSYTYALRLILQGEYEIIKAL